MRDLLDLHLAARRPKISWLEGRRGRRRSQARGRSASARGEPPSTNQEEIRGGGRTACRWSRGGCQRLRFLARRPRRLPPSLRGLKLPRLKPPPKPLLSPPKLSKPPPPPPSLPRAPYPPPP